ncbi:hydantoinase/oxoprolinase family protein [Nocardioides sp. R-C-SC26]|uniref:hydantoinase/oxoprolinase family protein n=1 Tax=Nocardioides sp. R-C-SC26 TaxID=2870414 RepID=UPI001E2E3A17|nr:hydantoinase/oxoprolinase family protein [Nocardioides sp. R-C-SC26]
MHRLAIDIGGTFTDVALLDEATGRLTTTKHLTTADEPVVGVIEAVDSVLAEVGVGYGDLADVVHATTLATNTVLERDGDRVGLLTTEGFADVLTLQRQKRYELYDFTARLPEPLARREDTYGIRERMGADGEVVSPLDESSVVAAADALAAAGVTAVAVCYLNSYLAPEHEVRTRELLEKHGGFSVSCSHEVAPVIREYERFSTCVTNAYVQARIAEYLASLERALADRGFGGTFFIMQSSGGLVDAQTAGRQPVRLIESGPAAGVIAASRVAAEHGWPSVLSFDMGGTTAKLCLVEDGAPTLTHLLEVDRTAMKPRSGLPLMMPAVDLVEIGTGGGSIATPEMGAIRVGPTSAGASPGPASYGLGGTRPTVTDSSVALGYVTHLNADFQLKPLDVPAAETALRTHLGDPLGLDVAGAAAGLRDVAVSDMANAARLVTTERGHDPRDAVLFALGGAGPMHAASLAQELGVATVVVPPQAGVGSAVGLFQADVVYSAALSRSLLIDAGNADRIGDVLDEVVAGHERDLAQRFPDGLPPFEVDFEADLRFVGQGHELSVAFERGEGDGLVDRLREAFLVRYRASYPLAWVDRPLEAITWHVHYRIRGREVLRTAPQEVGAPAPRSTRRCLFGGHWHEATVLPFDAPELRSGAIGPAIVEQNGSTVVVPPGWRAAVGDRDLLVLTAVSAPGAESGAVR